MMEEVRRLREIVAEQHELLDDLAESVSDIASPEYVSEDWNEDAHLGKITITVKDARRLYKILGIL